MSEFKVSIVSSNEEIFSGTADMLYATGSLGEIGIAPGHSPLITGLMPGPVRVCNEDNEETFFCSGGFIEVQPDIVTVLSDPEARILVNFFSRQIFTFKSPSLFLSPITIPS